MNIKERMIVALDIQTKDEFDFLTKNLKNHARYMKVGMELYYTFGPDIIRVLKELGYKVFLDLKIHDIPNTAKKAAKTITQLGVDMINVHAAGGVDMMMAAREGMQEALDENRHLPRPLIIAVTQLTSSDQQMITNDLLIQNKIQDVVIHYAKKAKVAGMDGVVASPLEVKTIKKEVGHDFLCVTPGIRPLDVASNDQKRVTTPEKAIEEGSDYIVVGRSITQAQNPALAFEKIISNFKQD